MRVLQITSKCFTAVQYIINTYIQWWSAKLQAFSSILEANKRTSKQLVKWYLANNNTILFINRNYPCIVSIIVVFLNRYKYLTFLQPQASIRLCRHNSYAPWSESRLRAWCHRQGFDFESQDTSKIFLPCTFPWYFLAITIYHIMNLELLLLIKKVAVGYNHRGYDFVMCDSELLKIALISWHNAINNHTSVPCTYGGLLFGQFKSWQFSMDYVLYTKVLLEILTTKVISLVTRLSPCVIIKVRV